MKTVRYHDYGGPEVLCFEDAPIPEPGPGEVLVRVHAAGVNPADRQIRAGLRFRLEKPLSPARSSRTSGDALHAYGISIGGERTSLQGHYYLFLASRVFHQSHVTQQEPSVYQC